MRKKDWTKKDARMFRIKERTKGPKSDAWLATHPNKKSTPKEIIGSHGHRPHGPSILWPALYEHLRAKGKTKAAAAAISNAAWKKKKVGMKTNTPTSIRGVVKSSGALYGVWVEGRNTPIVVRASSASEARAKCRAKKGTSGTKNTIKNVRRLDAQEAGAAGRGDWIRTRSDGTKVTGKAPNDGRGMGPPRVQKNDEEFAEIIKASLVANTIVKASPDASEIHSEKPMGVIRVKTLKLKKRMKKKRRKAYC